MKTIYLEYTITINEMSIKERTEYINKLTEEYYKELDIRSLSMKLPTTSLFLSGDFDTLVSLTNKEVLF